MDLLDSSTCKFLMQDGFTPMYLAAKNNHPRLVELLLVHGADINKVATALCNVKIIIYM